MAATGTEEIGPVDYVVIEWPDRQPNGEIAPIVEDLVERGLIRLLDVALIAKDEDGTIAGLEASDVGEGGEKLRAFEGASSGLLTDDDIGEAAAALEPGASAALLVYENRWAAPFTTAVRQTGGELVASGRIPAPALLAALEEAESKAAGKD
jgi:uncharacterized membrane protein